MRCMFEWIAPFWGGDPDAWDTHICDEYEYHDGRHRCQCGETMPQGSEEDR